MNGGLNSKNSNPIRGWFIWFLPAFFMFYQYGVQIAPSLKVNYLETHYIINAVEVATISSSYSLAYMLFQIPMGMALDRFDARKILTAAMLCFALGTLAIFFSNHYRIYTLYLLGRFMMGIAATSASIGSIYLASIWLDNDAFKFAVGLTKMMSILGVLVMGLVFSFLLTFNNWSQLIFENFLFCLLLALIFWIFLRDNSEKAITKNNKISDNLSTVIYNKSYWLCVLFIASIFVNITVLTNVWRIDFLEHHYHFTRYQATIDNGFTVIGFVIGAPLLGYLAKKVSNISLIILICAIGTTISLLVNHYFIHAPHIKLILYLLIGFFSASFVLGFILLKQIVPHNALASALGINNMVGITTTIVLMTILGELLDHYHGNYILAATPVVIVTCCSIVPAFFLWLHNDKTVPSL